MSVVQLYMMLGIIISLIVIITDIAVLIAVFSGRIISSVYLILLRAYTFPSDSRPLITHHIGQTQRVLEIHPSENGHC